MAIQKAYTHVTGITLASAYHKVTRLIMNRRAESEMVDFEVAIYKDQQARNDGNPPLTTFGATIQNIYPTADYDDFFATAVLDTVNKNVVSQCYDWMKAQNNLNGVDYTSGVTDV